MGMDFRPTPWRHPLSTRLKTDWMTSARNGNLKSRGLLSQKVTLVQLFKAVCLCHQAVQLEIQYKRSKVMRGYERMPQELLVNFQATAAVSIQRPN